MFVMNYIGCEFTNCMAGAELNEEATCRRKLVQCLVRCERTIAPCDTGIICVSGEVIFVELNCRCVGCSLVRKLTYRSSYVSRARGFMIVAITASIATKSMIQMQRTTLIPTNGLDVIVSQTYTA